MLRRGDRRRLARRTGRGAGQGRARGHRIDAIEWAREAERRGAGEVLLTSWDRDGTRSGYDLELTRAVARAVRVPVIASGGADTAEHIREAFVAGADAVLAASIFHDGDTTPNDIKLYLQEHGIRVRP